MKGLRVCAGTLAALCLSVSASSASPDAALIDRTLVAARAQRPPTIDGLLDDDCWARCQTASDFFDMGRGGVPTQPTEARVCYDDERIYVAFECFEERMDAVSAAVTQRDQGGMFEVDDCVAVLFDTYHDQRSSYAFAANLIGTRLDLRIADGGAAEEIAWDAVWDVATHRDDDRWTAEFAIPVDALRFVPGESMTWGAEFLRHATPSREDSRWVHQEGEPVDPAYYGDLCGISFAEAPLGLEVAVSAVGRYDPSDIHEYSFEPEDADWDLHPDAGLDVEWVPLPTLTVSATANPDFAQIEGDPNQINLTGDELYLDERRPFFSEGMELFQTPLTILYTRRMEDIEYGGKVGGRFGSTSFGALYTRSDDLLRTANADVITDSEGNPLPPVESDYVALALKQDVVGNATLGGYYTARERGDSDYSRTAAAVARVPFLTQGRASLMAARSFRPEDLAESDAYRVDLDYERAQYEICADFEWIGENFAPEAGFVSVDRRGRVGGSAEVDRDIGIDGDVVDEIGLCAFGGSYQGIDGGREYWHTGGVLAAIFQNKLRLDLSGTYSHDAVDYPDHPKFARGRIQLTTNLGAWSGYIAGLTVGDYHNSTYYSADAVACLQPHEHFTLQATATGVALRDYQDLDWVVERLRADWLITRASFVRLIAQGAQIRVGTDGPDYRSQEYDLNMLFGWEFRPGSMFYLAYNQPVERVDGATEYRDPVVVAKVTYAWSL